MPTTVDQVTRRRLMRLGLTAHDPERAAPGYVVYSPMRSPGDVFALDGDGDRDVGAVVIKDRILGVGHVAGGNPHQRHGGGLDDEIVDGNLVIGTLLGVEALAVVKQRIQPDVHGQVEMRHVAGGLGQPPGDGLAHG